jgi:3-phenylpropionate/cinnamic acid dioxygenase small subunit
MVQNPRSAMRRIVSNIEIGARDGRDTTVRSNFLLVEVRGARQFLWAGQTTHRLREADDGLRIRFKKVVLANNDQELPPMQFLL